MYQLTKTSFVTDELTIKNNKIRNGNFKLLPELKRETGKLNENVYFTRLILDIKSTQLNPFPVDVHIKFLGIFEFKDIDNEGNIFAFLKIRAVEIMYPYLRSMLSNLSVTAMLPPIMLPVVDVTKIFPERDTGTIVN